jgi:hypothetical protein
MRLKPTELATIAVALVALGGTVITALYTYTSRNRKLDIALVKIGISILRADPRESQTQGAREWAIEVIEINSRLKFSAAARAELLQNKLGLPRTAAQRRPMVREFRLGPTTERATGGPLHGTPGGGRGTAPFCIPGVSPAAQCRTKERGAALADSPSILKPLNG